MTQISSATPQGGVEILKTYSNARKLFPVRDAPAGVMTYGLGNIGNRSIESLVLDFSRQTDIRAVEDVARGLFEFIRAHYDTAQESVPPEQRPFLGFYVAGCSPSRQDSTIALGFLLERDRPLENTDSAILRPQPRELFGVVTLNGGENAPLEPRYVVVGEEPALELGFGNTNRRSAASELNGRNAALRNHPPHGHLV